MSTTFSELGDYLENLLPDKLQDYFIKGLIERKR